MSYAPAPVVLIQSPTAAGSLSTVAGLLSIGGLASDDVAVSTVVWRNAATGRSGSATGTGAWTATVNLAPGINAITVTAYDTSGNSKAATLVATFVFGGSSGAPCGSFGFDLLRPLLLVRMGLRRRRWV